MAVVIVAFEPLQLLQGKECGAPADYGIPASDDEDVERREGKKLWYGCYGLEVILWGTVTRRALPVKELRRHLYRVSTTLEVE